MIARPDSVSRKDANISAKHHWRTYADNLDGVTESHKRRTRRYRILGHAQSLLIKADVRSERSGNVHRTRMCHAATSHSSDSVTISLTKDELNSEATITGVQTCGCVWACPVCVHKVMIEKGQLIQKAIAWSDTVGLIPVMITLTASHHAGMSLKWFRDRFKAAYQTFTNHRKWRDFKRIFGVRHHIANVEITRGDNGWHYHKHLLLFMDKTVISQSLDGKEVYNFLAQYWLDCLAKNELTGIDEIALDVSTHGNVGEQYLTKIGLSHKEGNLEFELTGQVNKSGMSIWDILKRSYSGNEYYSYLYLEFVREMTGENFLTCSHGLNDILEELKLPESEGDNAPKTAEFEEWLDLSPRMWYVVKKAKIYHEILDIAARSRNVVKVIEHIRHTHDELIRLGEWLPPLHMKPDWIDSLEGSE